MFPCVSEMCFKKHNIIVFILGSSLLIYNQAIMIPKVICRCLHY